MSTARSQAELHQVQDGLAGAINSIQRCRISSVEEDIDAAIESARAAVSALSSPPRCSNDIEPRLEKIRII
jgi:predicted transcriptional regulator